MQVSCLKDNSTIMVVAKRSTPEVVCDSSCKKQHRDTPCRYSFFFSFLGGDLKPRLHHFEPKRLSRAVTRLLIMALSFFLSLADPLGKNTPSSYSVSSIVCFFLSFLGVNPNESSSGW